MIEVNDLRKSYNGSRGLDGFNLKVDKGELFGLVGPNGAGKTTLMKILASLLVPDSGVAQVAGMSVQHNRDAVKTLIG